MGQKMSNKNEVFEYLIDQLRQQLPVVDVMGEIKRWSIDRSIAGRGNYTDEENAIIDAYIGLEHNPYKKQCEDLAHEVQSLKNQLRDASALVAELQETIKLMNEDFNRTTNRHGTLPKGAGYVVGENGPEQSGFRKEGAQECEHSWIIMPGLFLSEGNPDNAHGSELCSKCGKREWDDAGYKQKNDTQKCEHEWVLDEKGDYFVCAKCGKQEAELIDCQHTNTIGLRKGFAPGFTKKCLDCGAKLR